tara:strand:+ start:152 stop:376 length:225 start_codon:yes stop_codon:yes gene_type:complete
MLILQTLKIVCWLYNNNLMLNIIFFNYHVILALNPNKQQVFLESKKIRIIFKLEGNYAFLRITKQNALLYHLLF